MGEKRTGDDSKYGGAHRSRNAVHEHAGRGSTQTYSGCPPPDNAPRVAAHSRGQHLIEEMTFDEGQITIGEAGARTGRFDQQAPTRRAKRHLTEQDNDTSRESPRGCRAKRRHDACEVHAVENKAKDGDCHQRPDGHHQLAAPAALACRLGTLPESTHSSTLRSPARHRDPETLNLRAA